MGMSQAGTFARSINAAATVISGQDTGEDPPEVVAASVVALATSLFKQQNAAIKDLDITEDDSSGPRSTYTGKPRNASGGSGSSGSGQPLSEKQATSVPNAIAKLGDATPYTLEDVLAASPAGGPNSERSAMIGKIFSAAYDN